MDISSYINILKEKALAWLKTSEQLHELLSANEYNSLDPVLSRREEAINGYLDCLDRLESTVSSSGNVEAGERFLVNLLSYLESRNETKLQSDLEEVRACFEDIREIDQKLQELASNIPKQIKQSLLDVQKKKPAVNAYQRTKFTPLNQFQRFDRSE